MLDRCRLMSSMQVLPLVSHNQHCRIILVTFHVFPCRTPSSCTASVIPTWVRRSLDWLLPVLPPRVVIRWNIGHFWTDSRHSNRFLHPIFPLLDAVASSGGRDLSRNVSRTFVVVMASLLHCCRLKRWRFPVRSRRSRCAKEERRSLPPICDAAVSGDGRRQER